MLNLRSLPTYALLLGMVQLPASRWHSFSIPDALQSAFVCI